MHSCFSLLLFCCWHLLVGAERESSEDTKTIPPPVVPQYYKWMEQIGNSHLTSMTAELVRDSLIRMRVVKQKGKKFEKNVMFRIGAVASSIQVLFDKMLSIYREVSNLQTIRHKKDWLWISNLDDTLHAISLTQSLLFRIRLEKKLFLEILRQDANEKEDEKQAIEKKYGVQPKRPPGQDGIPVFGRPRGGMFVPRRSNYEKDLERFNREFEINFEMPISLPQNRRLQYDDFVQPLNQTTKKGSKSRPDAEVSKKRTAEYSLVPKPGGANVAVKLSKSPVNVNPYSELTHLLTEGGMKFKSSLLRLLPKESVQNLDISKEPPSGRRSGRVNEDKNRHVTGQAPKSRRATNFSEPTVQREPNNQRSFNDAKATTKRLIRLPVSNNPNSHDMYREKFTQQVSNNRPPPGNYSQSRVKKNLWQALNNEPIYDKNGGLVIQKAPNNHVSIDRINKAMANRSLNGEGMNSGETTANTTRKVLWRAAPNRRSNDHFGETFGQQALNNEPTYDKNGGLVIHKVPNTQDSFNSSAVATLDKIANHQPSSDDKAIFHQALSIAQQGSKKRRSPDNGRATTVRAVWRAASSRQRSFDNIGEALTLRRSNNRPLFDSNNESIVQRVPKYQGLREGKAITNLALRRPASNRRHSYNNRGNAPIDLVSNYQSSREPIAQQELKSRRSQGSNIGADVKRTVNQRHSFKNGRETTKKVLWRAALNHRSYDHFGETLAQRALHNEPLYDENGALIVQKTSSERNDKTMAQSSHTGKTLEIGGETTVRSTKKVLWRPASNHRRSNDRFGQTFVQISLYNEPLYDKNGGLIVQKASNNRGDITIAQKPLNDKNLDEDGETTPIHGNFRGNFNHRRSNNDKAATKKTLWRPAPNRRSYDQFGETFVQQALNNEPLYDKNGGIILQKASTDRPKSDINDEAATAQLSDRPSFANNAEAAAEMLSVDRPSFDINEESLGGDGHVD